MIPQPNVFVVPFSRLLAPEHINARAGKTGKTDIDELADSIAIKGLIHALVVRPADAGSGSAASADKFEVIDGRRRHAALAKLVKARKLAKDAEIPVVIRNEDNTEALETSLIANTVRLPLHPVDQHEVFARLVDQGKTPDEIALRFSLTKKTVQQHLALGRLAPEIRDLWRRGKIDAKVAAAFTICPDHALQVAAAQRLKTSISGGYISDWGVRQELSNDRTAADSVSKALLDRYIAAGGAVSEDLFEDARYLDDGALLKKLRAEDLEAQRQKWLADGWSWVALATELPSGWDWKWPRVTVEAVEPPLQFLSAADRKRHAELDQAYDDAAFEELAEIETRAWSRSYSDADKQRSGVVISGNAVGRYDVQFGVIRPDGAAPTPTGDEAENDADAASNEVEKSTMPDGAPEPDRPEISQALLLTLTETLTVAAARALVTDTRLALRAAIAALTAPVWGTPVHLTSQGYQSGLLPDRTTSEPFEEQFAALQGFSVLELLKIFAGLVATSLDMRSLQHPSYSAYDRQQEQTGTRALVAALPADAYLSNARELFIAEDYFKRAPKSVALAAMEEMTGRPFVGEDAFTRSKKSEVAGAAATLARARGWLPPELRHPAYELREPEPVRSTVRGKRRLVAKDAAAEQRSEAEE